MAVGTVDYFLAVTQTLKPSKHALPIEQQLIYLKMCLVNIVRQMPNSVLYKFYFEFTQNGIFHAHGIIGIRNDPEHMARLIYMEIAKPVGFSVVKEIREKSLKGWLTYCTKDLKKTVRQYNALADVKQLKHFGERHFFIFSKYKSLIQTEEMQALKGIPENDLRELNKQYTKEITGVDEDGFVQWHYVEVPPSPQPPPVVDPHDGLRYQRGETIISFKMEPGRAEMFTKVIKQIEQLMNM